MIRSRRWSVGAALALVLALLGGASPMAADDPASVLPASNVPASAAPDALGFAADVLGTIGDSVLGGLGQTLGDAVAASTGNPCSGSGPLQRSPNGSVTVLLLGTDYRARPYIGERTDTIIAMNVASNGRIAMAAIPRDTVAFPLASGGTSGIRRVNSLYQGYKRSSVGPRGVDCSALNKLRKDVSKALDTPIPYYALIRMDEFSTLINRIGGIKMNIRFTLIDTHYSRNSRKVYVPKENGYQMNGGGNCGPKPKKCRSALRYARSRHGTEGGTANSDFRRVRRQQEIVFWAIKRVLARGNGSRLMDLLASAKFRVYSNLPKTTKGALALYAAAQGARFAAEDGKVFGPSRWASYTGRYTFRLKLRDVRDWVKNHFKP